MLDFEKRRMLEIAEAAEHRQRLYECMKAAVEELAEGYRVIEEARAEAARDKVFINGQPKTVFKW